jgi:hypothetical protein
MKLPSIISFLVTLDAINPSWAFQHIIRPSPRKNVVMNVASKETKEAVEHVQYSVLRGDGMSGGGGRAMPNASEEDSELRRPKVGAEMPKGRPSWFKVPAPSQGKYHCDAYLPTAGIFERI